MEDWRMKSAPSADFTKQIDVVDGPLSDRVKDSKERARALSLAKIILDDPRRDPDSTPSILARQLMRARERGLEEADKLGADTERFIEETQLASGSRNLLIMGVQWFRKRIADRLREIE
jgi:hypothetical protein